MKIDTSFLERCVNALDRSLTMLDASDEKEIEYEIYRSASIKEFEIILEQVGKLLKKVLKPYFASSKEVDRLFFKDIFRHALKHSLLEKGEVNRWLEYRDNRNSTAHDYGVSFAEETLVLLPQFVIDARNVIKVINKNTDA